MTSRSLLRSDQPLPFIAFAFPPLCRWLLLAGALFTLPAAAQSQNVGIGTTTPDASAVVELASTTKGLLVPRMTQTQRTTISSPAVGLLVYQTDAAEGFYFYSAGGWTWLDPLGGADNLGNHTATQNLNLGTNTLVGQTTATDAVGTRGLRLDSNGNATLGTPRTLTNDEQRGGLELIDSGGLLSTGTYDGNLNGLFDGAGTRLMWVPSQAAFRAGEATGTEWAGANLGRHSIAVGYNVRASGDYAITFGNASVAANRAAFAAGEGNYATGASSVALGYYAHTNTRRGSFVFADHSNYPNGSNSAIVGENNFKAQTINTFYARFVNGYRFYTSTDLTVGVQVAAGGNAWSTVSDSTKKERVRPVDGDAFLMRIGKMRLGSWNYKGQDPATMRHYGPMAQDFYAAFGHDGVGAIGEPTSINQADFDGVNLIAIQALYRRVLRLEAENTTLRQQFEQTAHRMDEHLRPTAGPEASR